jgi:hypothetical protein
VHLVGTYLLLLSMMHGTMNLKLVSNNYMYVYHLFVLPFVLEDEYISQVGRMYVHHHIILCEPLMSQSSTHRAMECVLENGEMTGTAV